MAIKCKKKKGGWEKGGNSKVQLELFRIWLKMRSISLWPGQGLLLPTDFRQPGHGRTLGPWGVMTTAMAERIGRNQFRSGGGGGAAQTAGRCVGVDRVPLWAVVGPIILI